MGIHRSLVLGLFVCLLAAAPASAQITASSILTPANGTELFFNGDNGSGSVTVSGTVTGATAGAKANLVCYSQSDTTVSPSLVSGIDVSKGTFDVGASLLQVAGRACRLAIVPTGTPPPPPTSAQFAGPAISVSDQFSHSSAGQLFGYYILTGTLPWSFALQSAGECAVHASYATDPGSLGSFTLFGLDIGTVGVACLPQSSGVGAAADTRSALQVDGLNAYLPGAIPKLTSQPGFIPLSYGALFNPAHDSVAINETEAPMICDAPATFPPTAATPSTPATCPSLHDSGIRLQQTTVLLPGGQVARVTQKFTSVDGRAHSIDALFGQSVSAPASGEVPGFEFPGQTSFATHAKPDSFAQFPAGPSSIIAISNAGGFLPATNNPIGAITYNRPPQSADFVTATGAQTATLLMHYADSVPANGSVVYDWSFSQASSSSALAGLEQVERDRFGSPTVSIRNPPNGTLITSNNDLVRVQGSVSDAIGVASLNVNGQGVIVRPGGIFGVTVTLHPGINTITATAANIAGNTSSTSVTTIYHLPPCKVPKLHGKTLRTARGMLIRAGCTAGKVKRVHSRTVRKGRIISSRPRAGSTRRRGTKINLVLSRGKPTKHKHRKR